MSRYALNQQKNWKKNKKRSRPISRVLSRAAIHLGRASPFASSNLPRNSCGHTKRSSIRSCSGWGLPCHRCRHLCGALLPHHFTLTSHQTGGIFSVALSIGSRPPGVTWHPAQWSPDFPPGLTPATARPTPSYRLPDEMLFPGMLRVTA